MRRKMAKVAGMLVVAASIWTGSASAEPQREVVIPPPPLPGLRHLPSLVLPAPGHVRHVRRVRRVRYVRPVRVRRYYVRPHRQVVWVRGHWVTVPVR
jgi:hypothetical protein